MSTSMTRRVARFAAGLEYDALPPDVVRTAKRLILDTLGTALAATTLGEGCREVQTVAAALGGTPQSTIFGRSVRVGAAEAAFANGALAHALNYDAGGKETGHLGVVCLAAPLALAEARGPIPGRRLLAAVVAAAEVTARVTGAVLGGGRRFSERVLAGQYFGYFGAAAGAGHVLGLGEDAMHSAFGLALMQVAGSREVLLAGDPPAKAIYAAFPNQCGAIASLLAEAGLAAQIDALEGPAGFYGTVAEGRFDAAALLNGLGETFRLVRAQFKPWPASAYVVPFIEAGIELACRHDLHDDDIAAVTVVGSPAIRNWCEPLAERRQPPNGAAASNSAPFCAAKALANRSVVLADVAGPGLRDARALRIAARTGFRYDEQVDTEGGVLEVTTADGRNLSMRIDKPLGHHLRPMTDEQLRIKFRDCASHAAHLSGSDVDALLDFVERLEETDDAGRLAALTAGGIAAAVRGPMQR